MLCSQGLGMKDLGNLSCVFHNGFHPIRKWEDFIPIVALKSLACNMLCCILKLIDLHRIIVKYRTCHTIGIIGHSRQEMPSI